MMSYFTILLLSVALSIDACVVSFSYGLIYNKNKLKNALNLAISFGFFQMLMPIIGYYLTSFVRSYIEPYSKIIVFFIFTILGAKFIIESFQTKDEKNNLCINLKCLIILGIATSIDAFSAGISLSLFGNEIFKPSLLIGAITFINSIIGFFVGNKLHNISTKNLEISAGIILIILGIKAMFM